MQAEWKVHACTLAATASPSSPFSRSFSSPAALLVKVMARIFHGWTGLVPLLLPARSSSLSLLQPSRSRCTMRCTTTRVLPLPGPVGAGDGDAGQAKGMVMRCGRMAINRGHGGGSW